MSHTTLQDNISAESSLQNNISTEGSLQDNISTESSFKICDHDLNPVICISNLTRN